MNIDRKRLLLHRAQARAALSRPDLPQEIRDQYKKALDHAEVALGLLDAMNRRTGWPTHGKPNGD